MIEKDDKMKVAKKTFSVEGSGGRMMLSDITYPVDKHQCPVVLFCHGFKGFKDWGHFNHVAEHFAKKGFVFVKFNLSHNGTTVDQPTEFADPEAFGNNNFSIELDDTGFMLDYISNPMFIHQYGGNENEIYLMGHSRGGGISILRTAMDKRVKKLVTWASIHIFGRYWSDEFMKEWKENGVMHILNSRTKQELPMYYQSYIDFYDNKEKLDIPAAAAKIEVPWLIVHGEDDEVVFPDAAFELKRRCPHAKVMIVENAGHTFDAKHPWHSMILPEKAHEVVDQSIDFLFAPKYA